MRNIANQNQEILRTSNKIYCAHQMHEKYCAYHTQGTLYIRYTTLHTSDTQEVLHTSNTQGILHISDTQEMLRTSDNKKHYAYQIHMKHCTHQTPEILRTSDAQ